MSGSAKPTIDHEEIRKWVEERGGHPAEVRGTGSKQETGMIRIDFPGYSGENLCEITWEDWFQKFEENQLAFLHQDETHGHQSRFNKLVKRDSVELPQHAQSKK
ncbi:MAG TPA: hypothetical protein VGE41_01640 [Verrucomicrobiae bacterium]|jgi:hypothetical protein